MDIQEKRRELFEGRFNNFDLCAYQDKEGDTLYEDDLTQGAWLGFNAALDAVVIELPDTTANTGSLTSTAVLGYKRDCRTAIESTGLGIKIV